MHLKGGRERRHWVRNKLSSSMDVPLMSYSDAYSHRHRTEMPKQASLSVIWHTKCKLHPGIFFKEKLRSYWQCCMEWTGSHRTGRSVKSSYYLFTYFLVCEDKAQGLTYVEKASTIEQYLQAHLRFYYKRDEKSWDKGLIEPDIISSYVDFFPCFLEY